MFHTRITADKHASANLSKTDQQVLSWWVLQRPRNVRKLRLENHDLKKTLIKKVMTKKPISVVSDTLAVKALRIMNEKLYQV